MPGFSDYLISKLLDHTFGVTTYTPPATVFLAAYTVAPTSSGGGTEVTGGSYARKSVPNNTTNWANSSSGLKTSLLDQDFVQATASWGTIVAVGILDASTAGNLLVFDDFTGVTINNLDTLRLPAGDIDITLT